MKLRRRMKRSVSIKGAPLREVAERMLVATHMHGPDTLAHRETMLVVALSAIVDLVMERGRVALPNFGVFYLGRRKGRRIKPPPSAHPAIVWTEIPDRFEVRFRPSKEWREAAAKVAAVRVRP